ncbi:hypothetical protein ACPEIC_45095 [Stenotrophomonas sp. NPDC087984]
MVTAQSTMKQLTEIANTKYSRKGNGLNLKEGKMFVIIPYLPESSPDKAWMCLIAAFSHTIDLEIGEKPQFDFATLDISESDLKSLPPAKAKVRDQLLHWMAWEAFNSRRQLEK